MLLSISWDPGKQEEVSAALRTFNRAQADGKAVAYLGKNDLGLNPMNNFDPDAGKLGVFPRRSVWAHRIQGE